MTHGAINGSRVTRIYRATSWTRKQPVRLFVTADDKIWIGYGESPEGFSHVANVGDRNSPGRTRRAICIAANS